MLTYSKACNVSWNRIYKWLYVQGLPQEQVFSKWILFFSLSLPCLPHLYLYSLLQWKIFLLSTSSWKKNKSQVSIYYVTVGPSLYYKTRLRRQWVLISWPPKGSQGISENFNSFSVFSTSFPMIQVWRFLYLGPRIPSTEWWVDVVLVLISYKFF